MSGFGKGLGFIQQQREKIPSGFGQSYTKKLWLKDGETAKFYFLLDVNDLPTVFLHPVRRQRRNGPDYTVDVLCGRRSYDDPVEACRLCSSGDSVPALRVVVPVWVSLIIHPNKPDGVSWQPIRVRDQGSGATMQMYKEDVNEIRLFIMKPRVLDQLQRYVMTGGDDIDPQPRDTICDRAFRLRVLGSGVSRVDTLTHEQVAEVPDEVRRAAKEVAARDIDAWLISEFADEEVTGPVATRQREPETISYDRGRPPQPPPFGSEDEEEEVITFE